MTYSISYQQKETGEKNLTWGLGPWGLRFDLNNNELRGD